MPPGGCAGVEHVLDVPLVELSRSGIDLTDVRVRWRHRRDCGCGNGSPDASPPNGDAGRVVHGDPDGQFKLRGRNGEHLTAASDCLAVHTNTSMMARYLASLNGRGERDIADALYQATSEFSRTDKRWQNLEATASAFGELALFESVGARLKPPLHVVQRPSSGKPRRPVVLPPARSSNLNFQYGTPKLAESAAQGLRRHGPYDEGQKRSDVLRAVVVGPEEFADEARKLRRILRTGIERVEGLKERYHLRDFEAELELFPQATRKGYENAVLSVAKTGVDIVFLVTKRDFRYERRGENPYLAAKAALASSAIASQAVTVETLHQPDDMLQWSTDSVGLAAYTKVGNIPYVLHDPAGGRELVIGLGRADIYDPSKDGILQRYGASVTVRQDGDFLFSGSTTCVENDEDYEDQLALLIEEDICRFDREQAGGPDRLIVYFSKRTGRREYWAVNKAIGDRDIEFALIHVNRDSPLWLVERDGRRVSSPARGTTIGLSPRDRLLVTGDPRKPAGGHPLRLTLDDRSSYRDMRRLVQQAYGFTKTSYRGFLQGNEPSPVLFGRLLAQKVEELVPYGFNPATAAGALGSNPWFI